MALHFSVQELAARRARVCQGMAEASLDGLLIFRQESMYYLTGYDTFGYVFFQCLYLAQDGRMILLTRAPDLRQAQETSVIKDIQIWTDLPGANPAEALRAILADHGAQNQRLGVEFDAYGLTAANGLRLATTLDGFCTLADASLLVTRLRVVKSDAEIGYVRCAAGLADEALAAATAVAEPGAFEGEILAAMQGAVFKGGGDYPGNAFVIGSGRNALLCRYQSGRRHLDPEDQLTLEWAGVDRHYHAAMMATLRIGNPPQAQSDMFEVAKETLLAVEDKLTPGNTYGDAFDAHAATLDKAGFARHRMNACGYSLGTTFAPNWMDWPMLYHGNPVEIAPGMVIFVHIIIFDSDRGLAMTLGRTSLIGETGAEPLSATPLEFVVI